MNLITRLLLATHHSPLAIFFLLLAFLLPSSASAQVQTGAPPFGSFGGGPDVINLANLNAHWTIPVLRKPGRGTNFTYDISYDTSVWFPSASSGTNTWTPVYNWGWLGQTAINTGYISYGRMSQNCDTPPPFHQYVIFSGFSYTDAWGGIHPFSGSMEYDPTNCDLGTTSTMWSQATDGSGLSLSASINNAPNVNMANIITPTGRVTSPPRNGISGSSTAKDRNGNQITSDGSGHFYDTLSSTTAVLTYAGSGTPSSPVTFTYTAPSGGSASYTINYTAYTVQTKFSCSGVSEYGPLTNNLVSEIDLPDGSKYTFTYETTPLDTHNPHYITGRLASVTLPTGGTISYTYTGGPTLSGYGGTGITCTDGSAAGLQRYTPDTGSNYWNYARTMGSGAASATLITAPKLSYDYAQNQTIVQFQGIYETQRDVYQGSAPAYSSLPIAESTLQTSSLLQETQTCYNGSASPCTSTAAALPISQISAITQLDTSGLQSKNVAYYNSFGLPTEFDVFDYGSGAPSSTLIKKTLISYASLGNNINASQQTVTVCNGTGTSGSCTGTSGSSTGTVVSQTQFNYDETGVQSTTGTPQHVAVTGSRGNLTTLKHLVQGSTYQSQTYTYYDTGNVNLATDPVGAQTTYTYGACGNSFPTQATTTNGSLSLSNVIAWDCSGAAPTSTKDTNNQTTSLAYDSLWRITTMTRPDNVQMTYQYPTTGSPTHVVTTPVQGTNSAVSTTTIDGLGRAIRKTTSDNSQNVYAKADTQYDALGRAYKVSNPYTSSPSYWSSTQFDALGRTTVENQQDGAQTTYSYSGRTTTVSDPAGKQRKYDYDAAGRFFNTWEPDNNNSLTVQTSYTYTALDQISTITEGVQSRSYGYDLMGRLTSVTTPESGQTTFYFNVAGLISQRSDARGVQTNYVYDGLSRLTGKNYTIPQGSTSAAMPNVCDPAGGQTPTQNVCFYYDQGGAAAYALGRLTKVVDPSGSEAYTFDQLGRTTQVSKAIGTTTYNTQLQYNLAGEGTTGTYPSSRVVQGSYDAIGRLCAIGASGSTCSSGTTFLTGLSYNPAGQLTGATYGNSVIGTFGYSADRLEFTSITYAKGPATLFGTSYWYKTDSTNCPSGTSGNNGQIQCITDTVDSGRNVSYSYDGLYRLISATTNGSTNYPKWGLTWAYDRYGNRLNQTQTYGNPPANSLSFANPGGAQTNRQDSMCFDASGNLLAETAPPCPSPTYIYDGENRLVGYQSAVYTLDFAGLRIKKQSGGTTTVYVYSGSKPIAEYDNGAPVNSPSREYIYAGSRLLAKIEAGATNYFHYDHLSARVLTDSSGNVVGQRGHYPFGETWYETGTTTKWKFTSYERDSESSNDYAIARSFVNRFGRFSSPDPVGGVLYDPQSLNRYAYALNDPCNRVDPLGLEQCTVNVQIQNQADLSSEAIKAAENQIQALLGQATSDGNTIGVSFVSRGGDFTLSFENAPWYISGDTLGMTWCPLGPCSSTSHVYVDNAVTQTGTFNKSDTVRGTVFGSEGAHELGHSIGNLDDLKYHDVGGNLMSLPTNDNHNIVDQGFGVSPDKRLTPEQMDALYKACINKHPPKPPAAKGNGGGGGGGGGGWGAGGQWVFWEPDSYGSEGVSFGTGQWIWWPSAGRGTMSVL